jgi:alpha-L-fucosidase
MKLTPFRLAALSVTLVALVLPVRAEDVAVARAVRGVDAVVASAAPFAANWTSLAKFQAPEWYQDRQVRRPSFIGGAYSVPAFGNEWYPPQHMYPPGRRQGLRRTTSRPTGPSRRSATRTSCPRFKAEQVRRARWAALFKAAGSATWSPVAEHHDGFAMYD